VSYVATLSDGIVAFIFRVNYSLYDSISSMKGYTLYGV